MTDRDFQRRAEAVFLDLVDLPSDQRSSELARRCAGDAALEREVRGLLSAHERGGDVLSNPELLARSLLAGLPPTPEDDQLPPGTILGDYTIRSFLGAGGMGSVYIAEQQRPRRTVALKVIRHASRSLLRRFEHEAEILGRLQHPGIAQIFEAGTAAISTTGHHIPFIAMELVDGSPITEHSKARHLSSDDRLDLLARVCDAVHHAHQRAVIHRDLKPANILITRSGEPKILDFGVARALDLQFTTAHTNVGQLIGTLPYMSPEQVSGDPRDIDTRSDVYALGVILYQLLADRLPLDLSNRSVPEAISLIRSHEHESLSRISRVFRGEIDTIVSRALEKDKDRRYQSAAALAEDIRRFLRAEPILAKQDSAMYLLRKAIRRYRALVAGISLAVIALVGFSLFAWRQSRREASAREDAQLSAIEANRQRALADKRAGELSRQLRTNTIERARLLAQNGNLRLAEDILWPLHRAEPSPHSGWALWDMYLRMPCIATLRGSRDEVFSLAVSDDETRFATGGEQGHCTIWDGRALSSLAAFDAHERAILGMAFLRDGTLVTGSLDGLLRAWDQRGGLVRSLELPGGGVLSLCAFEAPHGAGRHLAAACRDGVIRIIDAASFSIVRVLSGGRAGQARVTADESGSLIVGGSEDGSLRLWTSASDQPLHETRLEPGSLVSIALSRDGATLATGGGPANRWIRTWSINPAARTLTLIAENRWNNGTVRTLQFSPDARRLLAGGYHRFEVLRSDTCLPAPSPIRFSQPTMRAAWLPTQGRILASDGPNVRIWQDSEERIVRRTAAHPGGVSSLLSLPEVLLSSGADGLIRAWSLSPEGSLSELFRLEGHRARVRSLHAAGNHLVSVGNDPEDGAVTIWDLQTRQPRHRITRDGRPAFAAALSPDGARLAVSFRDRVIRVYDASNAALIHEIDSGQRDTANITFADGLLVSTHSGGRLNAWDASSWQSIAHTNLADGVWSVAPLGGGAFAVGGWTGTVTRWEPRTGVTRNIPTAHTQMVTEVHASMIPAPGSTSPSPVLLSSGSEGTVCLSDPDSALALASISLGDDSVLSVVRREDFIIAALSDGTLAVIDVREGHRHIEGNRPAR